MDEVDGMSAGDRGGVGALKALIKKTKVSPLVLTCAGWLSNFQIPIICIANDVQSQKLKPLLGTAALIQFQKFVMISKSIIS
jgi:replication factor C subunit 1